MCRTDDQFFEFCRVNSELRIERDAGKGVRVRPPVGWDTARKNARISLQLLQWADADGTGEAADSSAGYRLPNGALLGWLIDPLSRRVLVYRPGREMEEVAAPVQMSGEPLLRGFRLQMAALW